MAKPVAFDALWLMIGLWIASTAARGPAEAQPACRGHDGTSFPRQLRDWLTERPSFGPNPSPRSNLGILAHAPRTGRDSPERTACKAGGAGQDRRGELQGFVRGSDRPWRRIRRPLRRARACRLPDRSLRQRSDQSASEAPGGRHGAIHIRLVAKRTARRSARGRGDQHRRTLIFTGSGFPFTMGRCPHEREVPFC